MINVIIGEKGTGKTARLIEAVHIAEQAATGSVVFVNKGKRHVLDLSHTVRLVDTEQFNIKNPDVFLGFIEGIISQNFDITDIYIDSVLKIASCEADDLACFLKGLEAISSNFSISFVLSVSANPDTVSEDVKKYAVEF